MKKLLLLLGFACSCGLLFAQTSEKYSEVQIDLHGKTMPDLARLGIAVDHGEWLPPLQRFTTVLSTTELQLVQQAGFSTKIIVADLQQDYLQKRQHPVEERSGNCASSITPYQTPANYTYGSMGGYQTYAEMLAVLDDMRAKFPNLISVRKIVSDTILTHEGRPLWSVKISDNADLNENEPAVLYTALHHAREPNGMSQMLYYMWYLLENYPANPDVKYLVDHEELYFVPCVNPDGYVYNETTNPAGGGYWRKNRRNNGDGTFGVDLNRNYGFQWAHDDAGSSPNPAGETYRGPGPFSEPESRMLRDFGASHQFVTANNYHTFGNLLIYPWSYSDMPADSIFVKLGRLYTRENRYKAGTPTETVGYPVNGDANDWLFSANGTYSFTAEIGKTGFWPQPEEIEGLNRANLWQNLAMALTAGRYGEVKDASPNATVLQTGSLLPLRVTRYGLEDGPLTTTIMPVSANILSMPASQTFNLAQFQSADFNYDLELLPGTQPGDEIVLLLQINNGLFTHTDTLRKTFGGQSLTVFNDPGNNLLNWNGDWGTTTQSFVSAPSSITDSPTGPYAPNTVSELTAKVAIPIPAHAVAPQLRFWARWEIEKNYDFVEVQGIGSDNSFAILCGQYTVPGGPQQDPGQPLFDGYQYDWVEESMDLSAFKGLSFFPVVLLVSDQQDEYDGFYFDDMRVVYQDSVVGTQVILPVGDFRLRQNQPNPANGGTRISWENEKQLGGTASFLIFNALGEKMWDQPLQLNQQKEVLVNTQTWPNGLYTYLLRTVDGQTLPRKMTVLHP